MTWAMAFFHQCLALPTAIPMPAGETQPGFIDFPNYPQEKADAWKHAYWRDVVSKGGTVGYQSCMKRTRIYPILFTLTMIFAAGFLASYTEAKSRPLELPGGFELGSSLDEAQQHASSRGWELVRLSPELPGQWKVEGNTETQIGLFVCGDAVTSVRQYKPGDLDEFAKLVWRLSFSHGEPDTQIVTFMAGVTRISNVDARFAEFAGLKAIVQLSSTAGRLGISTNYFVEDECQKP